MYRACEVTCDGQMFDLIYLLASYIAVTWHIFSSCAGDFRCSDWEHTPSLQTDFFQLKDQFCEQRTNVRRRRTYAGQCRKCRVQYFLRLAFWNWVPLIAEASIFSTLTRRQMTEKKNINIKINCVHFGRLWLAFGHPIIKLTLVALHSPLAIDWRNLLSGPEIRAYWNFDIHRFRPHRNPGSFGYFRWWCVDRSMCCATRNVDACSATSWNNFVPSMYFRSTIYPGPMWIFYHDIKRPLSCCTFAVWTLYRHSRAGYQEIHGPVDCRRPIGFFWHRECKRFRQNKSDELNKKCSPIMPWMLAPGVPSFSPIQCLSICPSTQTVRMTDAHQARDVYPSTPNRSICHMWRTPIADYERHIRSISEKQLWIDPKNRR